MLPPEQQAGAPYQFSRSNQALARSPRCILMTVKAAFGGSGSSSARENNGVAPQKLGQGRPYGELERIVNRPALYIVRSIVAVAVLAPLGIPILYRVNWLLQAQANPIELTCKMAGGPTTRDHIDVSFFVQNKSDRAIDSIGVDFSTPMGPDNFLTFGAIGPHSSYSRVDKILAVLPEGNTRIVPAECTDTWATFSDGSKWTEPYRGPWLP